MKTKTFKNGKLRCKSYLKPIGNGYEVGFLYGTKHIFIGNFIHSSEANKWYSQMNREIARFGKQFKIGPSYPVTWFKQFISHSLYQKYYAYTTKLVTKHKNASVRHFTKDVKKYRQLKKKWTPAQCKPSFRNAA